jgi:hypothetical protein
MTMNMALAKLKHQMVRVAIYVPQVPVATSLHLEEDYAARFDPAPTHDAHTIHGVIIPRVIFLPAARPRLAHHLLDNSHPDGFFLSIRVTGHSTPRT